MRPKTIATITSLVILVALGAIWLELKPVVPVFDRTLAAGIGQALVEETIKAVNDQGPVVVVLYGDPSHPTAPVDPRLAAFKAELQKHGTVQFVATEFVQPNPDENNGLPGCPPTAFQEILHRQARAAAIVLFMEIPEWDRVKSSLPGSGAPKLIALVTGRRQAGKRYGGYFASGQLAALILPRRELVSGPNAPKTPREWFDKYYQVYTPANYESLPE